jgi:hypothetical protein
MCDSKKDMITEDDKQETIHITRSMRKPLKASRVMIKPLGTVEPLDFSDLVLSYQSTKAYFQRLLFKYCPKMNTSGKLDTNIEHINMEREQFTRHMYELFRPNFNLTWHKHFVELTLYINYLDSNELNPINNDYFNEFLIKNYLEQCTSWVQQGRYKTKKSTSVKTMFVTILKAMDRNVDAKTLPIIKNAGSDLQSFTSLDLENQLKPVSRELFRAFRELVNHLEMNMIPEVHPLWNEVLFEKNAISLNWTKNERRYKKIAFKHAIKGNGFSHWHNQITKIAIMIFFMLTGINSSSLLKIKRSDVSFSQLNAERYILNITKSRANYQEQDSSLGFTKFTKDFIETWLNISKKISAKSNIDYLFPKVTKNNDITCFSVDKRPVHSTVNKLLIYLGLASITSSTLRKTKADALQKTTNDFYLISISLNNSIETVKRSYSSGLEQDHRRDLSASIDATYKIAKGIPIQEAISGSKNEFNDVLSEYDYKRLRVKENITNDTRTMNGGRCIDNKSGNAKKIEKILKNSGIITLKEESRCTDFLECFECKNHLFVASVEDIWLILSLRETLIEMQQYPAVNSLPSSRYSDLFSKINTAITRCKEVNFENFAEALELSKSKCHPLYSTWNSLYDLLD